MTKKLTLLFALMLSTLMASAYDAKVDGVYYTLIPKGKAAEVTSGDTKYTGNVTIPESFTYNGVTYSVTSIGSYAFSDCSGLTSVTIPNSVTIIGEGAFSGCSGLTSVTIPNSVTSIGFFAFYGCSKLTSVTIPNSVTSIGGSAFYKCTGLKKVIVQDIAAWCRISFGNEDANPLYYAHHLYSDENAEITNLVIPNSVTSIGTYAFYECSGLTSVTIPNSVTSIGGSAFYKCSGLTSITIPNSVTSIGNNVFQYCSGLTSVTIPNSVKSIGERAFFYCSGLTSITIPNSVTSIGNSAFSYCYGLTSVTIPNSVTSIGSSAFRDCSSLTSVTIPNSVKSIGDQAFQFCSGLTSVTIGNSVTSIGSYAFRDCSGLTSVTIPNSVTSIGGSAFEGCSGLTSITIPNSVTSIGNGAFYGCSGLTSVTIGSGVRIIYSAFVNCSNLADVYCYAENVPSTSSDAFKGSFVDYATLYVPEASVAVYKAAEPWSGFGTIKTLSGDTPPTPETQKCSTPTISYVDGKLTFDCETEGVEYVSSITPPSAFNSGSKTVSMPTTYKVTVYATKAGYENSDVATKDINVSGGTSGLRGDVNNDGTVNMPDAMFIVNKILNGKFPDEE